MNDSIDVTRSAAEEQALMWLVDLDDLSPEEQTRFTAWLGERPEHGAAFEKMERQWRELDVLQQLAADTDTPDLNVVRKWLWKRRLQRHRRLLPLAAAAAFAVIAFVVWVSSPGVYEAHHQTAIGERQEIVLPDNSIVTLNTDSNVDIHYSDEQRRVYLQRGEAHFEVAPAPERPFSVIAGSGTVRAVGTSFNVYLKNDVVEVTVAEGIVEVLPTALPVAQRESPHAPVEDAAPIAETLVEGHRLEYRKVIESVSNIAPNEVARQLAWQDGMLDFQGETLAEVIEEASRYTSTRITIEDPELERLHVSGYFEAGDVDTLIELIESNDLVTVSRIGPQFVRIKSTRY